MSIQVSVLIDTYNHEKFIANAINSVLAQEGLGNSTVDIVVVDDGSTDGTGQIARRFGTAIRYYCKPNGGQASAFNAGIPACSGVCIAFLDGDDWWAPGKLRTVAEVSQAPGVRLNEGGCDPDGRFYCGSMATDFTISTSICAKP